jgi:hypothetical protein
MQIGLNRFIVLSIALVLLAGLAGAGTSVSVFVTDLIAGQHHDVGDVTVWNDADFLYVSYEVHYVWLRLKQTHLHTADSLDGIPHNKNNIPVPGKFAHKTLHDRWVQEFTYEIPMDPSWAPDTDLFIASHAVISGECGGAATAWGDGPKFPCPTWGTYFIYTVE